MRTQSFLKNIVFGEHIATEFKDKTFVGLYECCNNVTHDKYFYEYWNYCVNNNIIEQFFKDIYKFDENVLEHTFCDLVFANYLRTLKENFVFIPIHEQNYNYTSNNQSITGQARTLNNENSQKEKRQATSFKEFIDDLNYNFQENIKHLKNSVFMLAIWNYTFEESLEKTFKNNYQYREHIDSTIINELKREHLFISRFFSKN